MGGGGIAAAVVHASEEATDVEEEEESGEGGKRGHKERCHFCGDEWCRSLTRITSLSLTFPVCCSLERTLCFHPMPPTQPLPDTPAPSHLFETHNMGSDTQPTAPQMPSCENCGVPAQLQCGMCVELFFCDTPACYDACHTRPRDREAHRASVTSFGASSKCALHPGQELCVVCEDPACGDALICMRCDKCDTHAGHKTVDITDYMKHQRDTLHSHVADLTSQRTAAEEKCRVLEALPPTEDRYKDLLLQTHVGHLVMREDVSRSEVVCEEEVARSFLTQALSREGEVCALKTFVAKAGHMIAECKAVCRLGDNQVLRAVPELQAVVRNINSMAASGDRHRLVGAADPHATFSLNLPVSNVHDALAQMSALFVPVLVQGLDGVEHEIEVSVDDTGRDLLRKVASAVGLREDGFDMTFRDEVIAEGEDVVQLRGHRVVVKQTNTERRKQDAIGALHALGETTLTEARLKQPDGGPPPIAHFCGARAYGISIFFSREPKSGQVLDKYVVLLDLQTVWGGGTSGRRVLPGTPISYHKELESCMECRVL